MMWFNQFFKRDKAGIYLFEEMKELTHLVKLPHVEKDGWIITLEAIYSYLACCSTFCTVMRVVTLKFLR